MAKGLLVSYNWCTGCHSCELACQAKNDLPPDQFGIKLNQMGPWEYAPKKWVYTYLPAITQQCNFCADRLAEGKMPSCVQHCQSNCIQIMDAEEAAEIIKDNPHVMFITQ